MSTVRIVSNTVNLKELALSRLIAAKHCSTQKTKHYDTIVYGPDINMLESCRQWIFDKEIQKKGIDYEQARINANKLVLYVNSAELARMEQELRQ